MKQCFPIFLNKKRLVGELESYSFYPKNWNNQKLYLNKNVHKRHKTTCSWRNKIIKFSKNFFPTFCANSKVSMDWTLTQPIELFFNRLKAFKWVQDKKNRIFILLFLSNSVKSHILIILSNLNFLSFEIIIVISIFLLPELICLNFNIFVNTDSLF